MGAATFDDQLGEQYLCIEPPHLLDADRTALFVGYLAAHRRMRLIGADGQAGLVIEPTALDLCAQSLLTPDECNALEQVLGYELSDQDRGLFYFHYHHMHLSMFPITP